MRSEIPQALHSMLGLSHLVDLGGQGECSEMGAQSMWDTVADRQSLMEDAQVTLSKAEAAPRQGQAVCGATTRPHEQVQAAGQCSGSHLA